jgi:chromosome segregation ATPase
VNDAFLGLMIESLVAVLLVLTIGYCLILNRRLKRLRADESSLRATISELVAATQIAERAIEGLKTTVADCDSTLGERLRNAERIAAELSRDVRKGEEIVSRIHRIAVAARGSERSTLDPAPAVAPVEPKHGRISDTLVTAQALASRTRQRAGQAA